jgi:gluconolactonase
VKISQRLFGSLFLEDGSSDLNIYAGDWWTANQGMLSALAYSGYEVNHSWGSGGHDSKHAAAIMGEAMEWLWKDYPAPVTTHKGAKPRLDLLIDGEAWEEIKLDGKSVHQLTVDKSGSLYFADKGVVYRVNDQQKIEKINASDIERISAGPSELFGWIKASRKIVSIDNAGKMVTLVSQCDADYLYTTAHGLYFTDTTKRQIGFYHFAQKNVRYFTTEFLPGAMALSAEKTFLNVASRDTPFGHSFKVNSDGSLQDGQPYVHYHTAFGQTTPGIRGMDVDSSNVLFSTSNLGVQVSDQLGRVNFIFSKIASHIDDVKVVGERMYVSGDSKLFVRKIGTKGIRPFDAPVVPPKPQL